MLHVPSFTPAPPAHEVPDTVLDTGNTEERREEKPGRHSCPGGGGLLRGLLLWREGKPSLRNPTKSCGVTSMVHRRGLGTVRNWKAFWRREEAGAVFPQKLQLCGMKEEQVRAYFALDTVLWEVFFHELIQLSLTTPQERRENSPIYRWGHRGLEGETLAWSHVSPQHSSWPNDPRCWELDPWKVNIPFSLFHLFRHIWAQISQADWLSQLALTEASEQCVLCTRQTQMSSLQVASQIRQDRYWRSE